MLAIALRGAAPHSPDETPPADPAELKLWLARQQEKSRQQLEEMKRQAAAESTAAPRRSRRPLFVLPTRNEAELGLLAATQISAATLPAEAERMVRALRAAVDPAEIAEADAFLRAAPGNSSALASAAAIGWVQKSPGAALLLAAEAVRANPGDWNALNTLGSLLSMAGYGHKAVPLLRYQVQQHPQDARAHNNLGQAWLTLGDITQAEEELARCLALAPRFGAAHASLGAIAHARGDLSGAKAHAEAAAAENLSPTARRILDEDGTPYPVPASFDRLVGRQEYFSPSHFVPPRPQRRGEEGRMKVREMEAFMDFVRGKKTELQGEVAERDATLRKMLKDKATEKAALVMVTIPVPGIAETARIRIVQARLAGQDVIADAQRHYDQAVAELRQQKEAAIAKMAATQTGSCETKKAIIDHYLDGCANRYGELEDVVLPRLRDRTNRIMTELALCSSGPAYQVAFAAEAQEFLNKLATLASQQVTEAYSCEVPYVGGSGEKPNGELPRMTDCPINIKAEISAVGFKVATLKINCTSFGFDFKAGLAFSANKNFVTGETTLTAGLGEELALASVGKAISSAQFALTWDRNNNLIYAGVEFSGSAKLNGLPGLEREVASRGDSDKIKAEVSVEVESPLPTLAEATVHSSLGVTIGPEGLTPQIGAGFEAAALGHQIFEAKLP